MISVLSLWPKQDTGAGLLAFKLLPLVSWLRMGNRTPVSSQPRTPQDASGFRPTLLISMAIMLWIFLLSFTSGFESSSGADRETLCASSACFTAHMEPLNFEAAHRECVHNGGSLVAVRTREDEEVLRSLLSKTRRHHRGMTAHFWIGLKLPTANCVSPGKALRGFKWTAGEEESQYSNWGREPDVTCTTDRCVRVAHTLLGHNQLRWVAGSCKSPIFYACKFNFKGMCKPLVLAGPGRINYTLPFSQEPERSRLKSFPVGSYAIASCSDKREHYSVCQGPDDWSVSGPFCTPETRDCALDNGGCQHECRQDAGQLRCFCQAGYDLDEDGLSCRPRDPCRAHACEHQCVAGDPGFFCTCARGFRLEDNRRDCSDVDECLARACGDHACVNTRGGYTCACADGYELARGECADVDECAQSRCQHGCSNSAGSFSCYCHDGFALSEDGRSCVAADADACAAHRCQFACVSAAGGFRCACPQGSYLQPDGLNCAPNLTETSAASSDEPPGAEGNVTESAGGAAAAEPRHRPARTDAPPPGPANVTRVDRRSNASLASSAADAVDRRVIVCVLGSVVPLLALIAVTLAVAIFRCSRSKKEAKKAATADGYCWVSSGLDPRLEKLYESILTDDP